MQKQISSETQISSHSQNLSQPKKNICSGKPAQSKASSRECLSDRGCWDFFWRRFTRVL